MIAVYFHPPTDWRKKARESLATGAQIISVNPGYPLEYLDWIITELFLAKSDAVFISTETGKRFSLDEIRIMRLEMGTDPRTT
jgi:hypothetical protein